MTMMFEVADLAVASPATVSRCGMVYLEPSYIGLEPFVECWLKKLPKNIYPHRDTLQTLFDQFMQVGVGELGFGAFVIILQTQLKTGNVFILNCFI